MKPDFVDLLAIEIARRTSEVGARPEDWLNEGFIYRTVKEQATEVIAAGFADPRQHPDHVYPEGLGPNSSTPTIVIAFNILDVIAPGTLSGVARTLLAGMICGTVDKVYRMGRAGAPLGRYKQWKGTGRL